MEAVPDQALHERLFHLQATSQANDFWDRMRVKPDFKGKHILDFGCGRGGLVHWMLEHGAKSVVGVDINSYQTGYAKARLPQEWGDQVEIYIDDIRQLELGPFDMVVSCNTLEHVIALEECLHAVIGMCAPGGDLYLGFAPLWHSPFGHHRKVASKIPWIHLLRPEDDVLAEMCEGFGECESFEERGFNRAEPSRFREIFAREPVEIVACNHNMRATRLASLATRPLRAAAIVPALEKYVTISMYWHLRRLPDKKDN